MRSPDIVAVEEVQDNDGAANTAVTDATLTWNRFIAKVAEVGGPDAAARRGERAHRLGGLGLQRATWRDDRNLHRQSFAQARASA